MTNLLNLKDYDKLKEEKEAELNLKKKWQFYKRYGVLPRRKQVKNWKERYNARKNGIST